MLEDTIQRKIADNRKRHDRKIAEICSDQDLNEQAKRRHMMEVYEEAKREHEALWEQQLQEQESKRRRLEERLFTPSTLAWAKTEGEREAIRSSYRQAVAQVSGVRDASKLEDLLEQARRMGDKTLAKAVFFQHPR